MARTLDTKQRNIKKRLSIWVGIVTIVLLIPLLTKAPWTLGDYIFGAIVLYGSAALYEFATFSMKSKKLRIITAIAVLTILICIWGMAVASD